MRVDAAVRSVDFTDAVQASVQMREVLNLIAEGWRIENATSLEGVVHYILRREMFLTEPSDG